VISTVSGPTKQNSAKYQSSSSHSHATAPLEPTPEPVESRSSSGQTRRPASEPITKPSYHQQPQHHVPGARMKGSSDDGSHDGSRVKKPKTGKLLTYTHSHYCDLCQNADEITIVHVRIEQ